MLNIYVGEENIPKDLKFIYDPESITTLLDLNKDIVSRYVVKEIDKGDVIDSGTFKDRFGIKVYAESLSTTSKIILALLQTDFLVNVNELGTGGIYMLNHMTTGNAYISNIFRVEPEEYPIFINGKLIYNVDEFFEFASEVQCE